MSKNYKSSHYRLITRVEDRHFWFISRNRLILKLINKWFPNPAAIKVLEVGFGTGIVLSLLEQKGFAVSGVDVNKKAMYLAKKRTKALLYQKSIYKFKTNKKYDLVCAFDVLEHQTNDRLFLTKIHFLLKPGGILFINVPAGQWLWTKLDLEAGHKRRYETAYLKKLLELCGFRVRYQTHWSMLTLSFYIIWRRFGRLDNFLSLPPMPINKLLIWLLDFERILLRVIRLPIGSSFFVVAQRSGGIAGDD